MSLGSSFLVNDASLLWSSSLRVHPFLTFKLRRNLSGVNVRGSGKCLSSFIICLPNEFVRLTRENKILYKCTIYSVLTLIRQECTNCHSGQFLWIGGGNLVVLSQYYVVVNMKNPHGTQRSGRIDPRIGVIIQIMDGMNQELAHLNTSFSMQSM